jgi:hypothetical protein
MSAERRQSPRFMVSIPSTVTTAGGQTYVCEIMDLSETGCRIQLKEGVQLWGAVTLATEEDTTRARVIWSEGAFAGLWFPNAVEQRPTPGLLKRMWGQIRGSGRKSDA